MSSFRWLSLERLSVSLMCGLSPLIDSLDMTRGATHDTAGRMNGTGNTERESYESMASPTQQVFFVRHGEPRTTALQPWHRGFTLRG